MLSNNYCGYFRLSNEESPMKGTAFKSHYQRLIDSGISKEHIYFDLESGSKSDRENFLIVLNKCRNKIYDTLVIANLERLTRVVLDWELILKDSLEYNFEIKFLDDKTIDLTTPEGQMNSRFKAIFAQWELEKNRQRRRDMWIQLRKDRLTCRIPFGYIYQGRKIVIDDVPILCVLSDKKEYSYLEISKKIIDLYLTPKETMLSVSKKLREYFGIQSAARVKTKKYKTNIIKPDGKTKRNKLTLSHMFMKHWLNNPFIRGHLIYFPNTEDEIIYYDNHEAIMSESQWKEIIIKKSLGKRLRGNTNKRKYALTGHLYCGCCHKPLQIISKLKNNDLRYYFCRGKYANDLDRCINDKNIKVSLAENLIVEALCKKYSELTEYATKEDNQKIINPIIKQKNKELLELQQLQQKFNSDHINEAISTLKREILEISRNDNHLLRIDEITKFKFKFYSVFQQSEFYLSLEEEDKIDLFDTFVGKCYWHINETLEINLNI